MVLNAAAPDQPCSFCRHLKIVISLQITERIRRVRSCPSEGLAKVSTAPEPIFQASKVELPKYNVLIEGTPMLPTFQMGELHSKSS